MTPKKPKGHMKKEEGKPMVTLQLSAHTLRPIHTTLDYELYHLMLNGLSLRMKVRETRL
jgi:hypothetical protein